MLSYEKGYDVGKLKRTPIRLRPWLINIFYLPEFTTLRVQLLHFLSSFYTDYTESPTHDERVDVNLQDTCSIVLCISQTKYVLS